MPKYRFCPECGEPTEPRTVGGRGRESCPRCDLVYFHNPVPGAAAVLLEHGRILLARRASRHFRGRWYIPAGFVEEDETAQQAAVREAKEETGLDVELVELLNVHSGFDVPGRPVIGVYYIVRAVGGELRPGSDVDLVEYYALDDIPDLPFEGDRETIELLRNRRAEAR